MTIRRLPAPLRDFLRHEASGGIVLIAATLLALLLANGPLATGYFALLESRVAGWSLHHFVNDGLMTLFFLLVGLEIKRAFVIGPLARWQDRALPLIAAAGGMAVPALVYLAVVADHPQLARGWAIPAATDIAFAVGVLALLGRRIPDSLRVFLMAVAIADDLGAVLIIALAYTPSISGPALLGALLVLGAMLGLNRLGVRRLWPYLALAFALWGAVLASGIHPTVAGVLAALVIPIGRRVGNQPDAEDSPLHRLEHRLGPWVAYAVVPLFGLVNAGVDLRGAGLAVLVAPLPLAIARLFVGKQAGVHVAMRIAVALRLAVLPAGTCWMQVHGVALLCGIGFTMSLFIGGLAFPGSVLAEEVKVGVLGGSLLSALCGYVWLRLVGSRPLAART